MRAFCKNEKKREKNTQQAQAEILIFSFAEIQSLKEQESFFFLSFFSGKKSWCGQPELPSQAKRFFLRIGNKLILLIIFPDLDEKWH